MRNLLLALAVAASPALVAQDLTGGLQAGLAKPFGDFESKNPYGVKDGNGVQFGGHLNFHFNRQHALRLHLDTFGFSGDSVRDGGQYRDNTYGVLQFGADYVLTFNNPSRGPLFLAGVTVNKVKAKATWDFLPDAEATQNGRLGIRVGGGYAFNHWFSLEGTINHVAVDKGGADGFGIDALTWVGATAVFRFGGR